METKQGDMTKTVTGPMPCDWVELDRSTSKLLFEVRQMVDSLKRLAPVEGLPTAESDVLWTRLLYDHQRLGRYLTSLLEDLAQLASMGLAGASRLLDLVEPEPSVAREQSLVAARVLDNLTTISDQVMHTRNEVRKRIADLQAAADPTASLHDPADERAWERAHAQTAQLLQGLRVA